MLGLEDLHLLGRKLQGRFEEMESEPSSEVPAETDAAVVSF